MNPPFPLLPYQEDLLKQIDEADQAQIEQDRQRYLLLSKVRSELVGWCSDCSGYEAPWIKGMRCPGEGYYERHRIRRVRAYICPECLCSYRKKAYLMVHDCYECY